MEGTDEHGNRVSMENAVSNAAGNSPSVWVILPIGMGKVPPCGFLFHILNFTEVERFTIVTAAAADKILGGLELVLRGRHPELGVRMLETGGIIGNVYIGGQVPVAEQQEIAKVIMDLSKVGESLPIIVTPSIEEYEADAQERMGGLLVG